MPGRGRSRKSTPIEEARRRKNALLKKQAEEAEARRPREAAMATVALVIWINAHIAVCLTMLDCVVEIIDLVQDGSVRQARTPLVIMALTGIAWFHAVLPRDINQRGVAAGIGFFFIIVCGVAGYIAVTATNSIYGYEFFQVRWGAVYLGVALNLFAIWGYGSETRVEYAERMMSRGRFGSANRAIERELDKNPDNLQALQIQRELKEMIRLVS